MAIAGAASRGGRLYRARQLRDLIVEGSAETAGLDEIAMRVDDPQRRGEFDRGGFRGGKAARPMSWGRHRLVPPRAEPLGV
jgi:hypothetical protein